MQEGNRFLFLIVNRKSKHSSKVKTGAQHRPVAYTAGAQYCISWRGRCKTLIKHSSLELGKQLQGNTKRKKQRKNHDSRNVILRRLLHADAHDHKRIPIALKRFVSNLPLQESHYDDITGPDFCNL